MTPAAQPVPLLRCADCGRLDTPGRIVCSGCLSARLEPQDTPGEGAIVSFTTIRRAPSRFRDEAPYDVVVVDLDGGVRVTGRLGHGTPPPSVGARVAAIRADASGLIFAVEER